MCSAWHPVIMMNWDCCAQVFPSSVPWHRSCIWFPGVGVLGSEDVFVSVLGGGVFQVDEVVVAYSDGAAAVDAGVPVGLLPFAVAFDAYG